MRASCPNRHDKTHSKWHCHPCLTTSVQEQAEELKYLRRVAHAARALIVNPEGQPLLLPQLAEATQAWLQTDFYSRGPKRPPKKETAA